MKTFPRELRDWERISGTVRPHQTLGYLTPLAVPAAGFISMKGMKTVNHPLGEYKVWPISSGRYILPLVLFIERPGI